MHFFMGFDNCALPNEVQHTSRELSYCLTKRGMGLRATGWEGLSNAFLKGLYGEKDLNRDHVQVFLNHAEETRRRPWVGTGFFLIATLPNYLTAMAMAEEATGNWGQLDDTARREATLLVYQFLGLGLKEPCEQVVCYYDAKDGHHHHDWFFRFAQGHGAKLINMFDTPTRYKIEDFVAENTLTF